MIFQRGMAFTCCLSASCSLKRDIKVGFLYLFFPFLMGDSGGVAYDDD